MLLRVQKKIGVEAEYRGLSLLYKARIIRAEEKQEGHKVDLSNHRITSDPKCCMGD